MPLQISDNAIALIVTEEDSSEAYYTRHYTGFEWPMGASGPTVGIGYDCGYVTHQELRDDWAGIVSDDVIAKLMPAVGKRGVNARNFVMAHAHDVTITWDQALAEFKGREVTKWIDRVADELPNCNLISPDSLGALVSLAYNRGASFDLPGVRYSEMRAIKAHMAARRFELIPDEFLAMRRLWPRGGDLWNRRMHEAALFAKGIGKSGTASVVVPPRPDPAPDREPVVDTPKPAPADTQKDGGG